MDAGGNGSMRVGPVLALLALARVALLAPAQSPMAQVQQRPNSLFPGKLFCSVTVYDRPAPFGPKAPKGQEGRWIQMLRGNGWFGYFRIYGPEKGAFDGRWRPSDFEKVK